MLTRFWEAKGQDHQQQQTRREFLSECVRACIMGTAGFGECRPGREVDLPIHCRIIQTRCNVIQTLLQLNSNNSNRRPTFYVTNTV